MACEGNTRTGNEQEELQLAARVEEWMQHSRDRPLKVLVAGLPGVGKSALTNHLLGIDPGGGGAQSGLKGMATTTAVRAHERELRDGLKVVVFDTPGFEDPDLSEDEIILQSQKVTGGKVHLLLYCLSLRTARVLNGDVRVITLLTQAFGISLWKNAIFVLTFANEVSERESDYQQLIATLGRKLRQYAYEKAFVPEEITRQIPVLTAGYTDPIIAQEDGEWLERLYTRMLSIADYEVIPTLLSIYFSGEDIIAALRDFYVRGTSVTGAVTTAAAGGACGARVGKKLHMGGHGVAMGTAIGAVVGGVAGGLTGGAVGVVAYNFKKMSTIVGLKYGMWKSRRDDIQ